MNTLKNIIRAATIATALTSGSAGAHVAPEPLSWHLVAIIDGQEMVIGYYATSFYCWDAINDIIAEHPDYPQLMSEYNCINTIKGEH